MKIKKQIALLLVVLIALEGCGRNSGLPEGTERTAAEETALLAKAQSGDVAAMLLLGNRASAAPTPDQTTAFSWLLKAAEAGSPEAGYDVAMRYRNGNGVRKNTRASATWMGKAAGAGHAQARYEFVRQKYVLEGPDGEYFDLVDSEKAFPDGARTVLAELIALNELGITSATVDLATILHGGFKEKNGEKSIVVIAQDRPKAHLLLLPLAKQGVASAQRHLAGWADQQGAEVAPDAEGKAGEDWWTKLADQKDARELFLAGHHFRYYGAIHFRGHDLTSYEANQKALEWYEKSARLGESDAMLSAAQLYEEGHGTPKDEQAAFKWRKKAADDGSPDGQIALYFAYKLGEGVVIDDGRAFDWAMKLATHPTADVYEMSKGQVELAYHYWLVDRDPVLAYAWANIAAAAGNEEAKKLRELDAKKISDANLREAQRLSSNWTPGETITRAGARPADVLGEGASGQGPAKTVRIQGTGFFVNKTGDILTNSHVVDGCTEIRLPALSATATMFVADKVNDLAIVRTASKPDDVPAIADAARVKQGQEVVVFGYPLDGYLPAAGNVTTGLVSALAGPWNNSSLVQISAPVQQGNSGGPVIDHKGNVVGVVVAKADAIRLAKITGDVPQNVNFAVAVGTVRTFLETNGIGFDSPSWWPASKDAADLADAARRYTVKVECVK